MADPRSKRRALVTGASGFIGQHLVAQLSKTGWEVHAIVRPTSSVHNLVGYAQIHIDDGSTAAIRLAVSASDPDVCFHLASQFVAQHSTDDVETLVANNVAFGARVVEELSRQRPILLVNTGTAWQHVDGQPYRPSTLYAATKQAFQDILQYYSVAGLLRVVNLKLFDTYGANDPRPRLLPLLIEAARTSEVLEATPGEQLIDLVHVDDVVNAFLVAAETHLHMEAPLFESFAVSSGTPITVRELVARIEGVVGHTVPVRWGGRSYRPQEMLSYWRAGDPLPCWSPQIPLDDGLRELWTESLADTP
ncbi:MAG: NAD-dependent epimerase/dehydratase family protein [Acidimicrobiales bacterium]